MRVKKGRSLTAHELLDVLNLIRSIQSVLGYEETIREVPHPALNDLFTTLTPKEKLSARISSIINEYGEVKDSASPALSDIRRSLRRAFTSCPATSSAKWLPSKTSAIIRSICA